MPRVPRRGHRPQAGGFAGEPAVRYRRTTSWGVRLSAGRPAGEARLPEWLRPEWIEPVIEGGIGLGTLVVLPETPRRGSGPRTPYAPATARAAGGELSSLGHIIGHSAPFRQAIEKARLLAERDVPVLLQGETHVGKEVFARAIHAGGPRQHEPFVALNCGGLPRDLVASELFGYVEGAFSGARRTGRIGRIEAAPRDVGATIPAGGLVRLRDLYLAWQCPGIAQRGGGPSAHERG
jgi:Sigma-54 interaction domain